jgi:AcrR family transcriptional regulator
MSGADTAERLVESAITLGVTQGAGAMSLQAIAATADVSKALVLYHFDDKPVLLARVTAALGTRAVARLQSAAGASDPLEGWRALVRAEVAAREAALLAALAQDRDIPAEAVTAVRLQREESAVRLAAAIMASLRLQPRVPARFLGRLLLRHLDGLAIAGARQPFAPTELEAELDAFAVALLGLGR